MTLHENCSYGHEGLILHELIYILVETMNSNECSLSTFHRKHEY